MAPLFRSLTGAALTTYSTAIMTEPSSHLPCQTDFSPTASRECLRLRAELLRRLRAFFHERGFLEVETPLLSADVVVDRHLDPFYATLAPDPRLPEQGRRLWLQTSPEFAMKRLLASGYEAIYQVTRSFRNGEQGDLHNPEFTIAEWYRVGDSFAECMSFASELCESLLGRGPAERVSYAEAFGRYVGLDPHAAETAELISKAQQESLSAPASLSTEDRDGWLDFLLVELVQEQLGRERPTLLYRYPASQAALAQVTADSPPVAERFELYIDGIELANGYHELLDAEELSRRNRHANAARLADGKPPLPEESRLLAAMRSGLPDSCGVALGFDRLVMVAAGAKTLAEVIAFPIARA